MPLDQLKCETERLEESPLDYSRFHPMRRKLIATAIAVAKALPKVAVAGVCGATIAFALAITTPAGAQYGEPSVSGFSSDYPWFNNVPQYQGNQSFRWFMANHPDIAGALARQPGLLYDANWRSQFPALEEYLANHPYLWQALNDQYWSEGPAETQWGDYDNGQWRDAYWWHQNNPSWFYDNHMNWAALDSRWLSQDGAYDDQRQWHYGEWWYNQNPSWVTSNHPNWVASHREWARPAEQQRYRQQHAMVQQNQQRAIEPRQATQQPNENERRQNQQNQQRTVEQRQANVQQEQTMRQHNEQALQQQHVQQQQAVHENQQRAVEQRQANVQHEQTMRQGNQHQQEMNQQRNQERQQANRQQPQAPRQEHQQAQRQEHQQGSQPAHQQQQQHENQKPEEQHGNGGQQRH